jgi:phenylpyruvate tautomerase PptA (4-oxalocrotonate tautomerase family)
MPMLDVFIPDGAIKPEAEQTLIKRLSDMLLEHEGARSDNERAQSVAWVFLHHAKVFVGGQPAPAPYYRVAGWVPEGQYDEERRRLMTEDTTDAILDAEDGAWPRDPRRVWVFTEEVPDGTWGWDSRVVRLGDIAGFILDDNERGHSYAETRLAERRRARSEEYAASIAG